MNFISKLKTSEKIKKINYYLIVLFLFLYIFVVPSFGARPLLNYSVFFVLFFLSAFVILYYLFFKRISFNRYLLLVPIFVGYSFVGTLLFSHDFRGWLTLLLLCISFFVFYYGYKAIENRIIVLSTIVCGIFLFSLYYLFHYRSEILHFSSFDAEAFRLGNFFDNQNDVAIYCLFGFSISLYLSFFTRRYLKILFFFPAISIFFVGLTTGSRTFILIAVLVFLVFLFFKMKRHKLMYLITMSIVITLFFITINLPLPFMPTIRERLMKMISTFFSLSDTIDTSALSRSIWLDYGIFLGSKHILFGLGYGGFSIFSGVGTFTHSNIVEVFCDFGLPGALLFYLPILIMAYMQIKNKRKHTELLLPLIIMFLAISFSMVFFYNKMYYVMLALMYFVCFENETKEESISLKRCRLFKFL